MRKLTVYTLSFILLFVLIASSPSSNAASLSQIEKDIKDANEQMKAAEKKAEEAAEEAKKATNKKGQVEKQIKQIEAEIVALTVKIEDVAKQRSQKNNEKLEKEEELRQLGIKLDELNASLEKTQELKDTRTRLMFTSGAVSYLDVLLNATSFSDFLNRFDAIQSILQSDQELIKEIEKTRKELEEVKASQEEEYANLLAIVKELTAQQTSLIALEGEKEGMMSQLNTEAANLHDLIEDMEEISEEQEKLLMQLAAKVSKLNAEKNRIKNPYTGGKLGMPIDSKYRVTSNYGVRIHPITKVEKKHNGIDFGAPSGTPIYAAEDGIVILSEYWSGYGNCIIIDHGGGIWTLYGHIKNGGLLVSEGDEVKRGDKIALVGSTGNSTGPHLHFEVRKNEVPVNPSSYLQ